MYWQDLCRLWTFCHCIIAILKSETSILTKSTRHLRISSLVHLTQGSWRPSQRFSLCNCTLSMGQTMSSMKCFQDIVTDFMLHIWCLCSTGFRRLRVNGSFAFASSMIVRCTWASVDWRAVVSCASVLCLLVKFINWCFCRAKLVESS